MLSNLQVLAFVWRRWMSRPRMFTATLSFILAATACDLSIPWAAGSLIDAVADPARNADAAWGAWAVLAGLYIGFYSLRQVAFRFMNPFAARNMEELTNDAFARVQAFSSDWHADTFAGSTVRKVSRGMWGYDTVSDVLILMLGPALVVLLGLSVSVILRDPLAGSVTLALVLVYVGANVLLTTRYVRPANLKSNALDSRIGGALADAIGGVAAVKSFGAEHRESERFAETTGEWRSAVIRTWNRFADSAMVMNILLVTLQATLTGLEHPHRPRFVEAA